MMLRRVAGEALTPRAWETAPELTGWPLRTKLSTTSLKSFPVLVAEGRLSHDLPDFL